MRVVPDGVADVVTRILEDNIRSGTGTRAALSRPAAGKTGTTDEHADAWFVGYTPGLATAVWMGYTRGEIPMRNVHGIAVSGGSFPAEIWRRFMEPALAGRPVRDFPAPRQPVSFRTWERGPTALSYDPYYTPPTPAEPEEDDEKQGDDGKAPATGTKKSGGGGGANSSNGVGGTGGPPSSPAQPLDP
jgi:membrane peptidoglycan carboxypeptidase